MSLSVASSRRPLYAFISSDEGEDDDSMVVNVGSSDPVSNAADEAPSGEEDNMEVDELQSDNGDLHYPSDAVQSDGSNEPRGGDDNDNGADPSYS